MKSKPPSTDRPSQFLRQALLLAALSLSCGAAPLSWQTPATVSSDSAISLNGFFVHVGNFRSSGEFSVAVGAENILFENRPAQNAAGPLLAGEEARVVQGSGGKQTNTALFNVTVINVTSGGGEPALAGGRRRATAS